MKILGYERVKFNFDDGRCVEGNYLYLQDEAANPNKVIGMRTERIFISDQKASACAFVPKIGDRIRVFYNKYGKVDEVMLIKSAS